MFFNRPPKAPEKIDKNKIIKTVLENFKYSPHFWASTVVNDERKAILENPKKRKSEIASHAELAYLKSEIAEKFKIEIERLKNNPEINASELFDTIDKMIKAAVQESKNIRSYSKHTHIPKGEISNNEGKVVEVLPAKNLWSSILSHHDGNLEKNFDKVSKALSNLQTKFTLQNRSKLEKKRKNEKGISGPGKGN